MNLDPAVLKQISLFATSFAIAFLVALWLSLVFWVFRDIRTRTRDPFLRVLAIVITAVLFLPGILIYLIIRPSKSLEEDYQHALEEEALLQTIEDTANCPGCGRRVLADWLVCPTCHTRLKKKCEHCSKVIDLPWNLCPYCETPVSGMRVEPAVVMNKLEDHETSNQEAVQDSFLEDDEFTSHP